MTDKPLSLIRERAFVGGRWIGADDNACQPVDDPATGETIGQVPDLQPNETLDQHGMNHEVR